MQLTFITSCILIDPGCSKRRKAPSSHANSEFICNFTFVDCEGAILRTARRHLVANFVSACSCSLSLHLFTHSARALQAALTGLYCPQPTFPIFYFIVLLPRTPHSISSSCCLIIPSSSCTCNNPVLVLCLCGSGIVVEWSGHSSSRFTHRSRRHT
jgi:hypothetical protein